LKGSAQTAKADSFIRVKVNQKDSSMPNEAAPDAQVASPGHQAAADLTALINSTEDFVWSVDLNFRLVTFNQAVYRYYETGFGVRAAVGMRPEDLLPPERSARWLSFYECALKEGFCRTESVRADGRNTELTLRPIFADGEVVGISVFGTDITDRKVAEEARALLASVVESSNDAIHVVKLDGTIATWNRAAELLLGYTAEEIIGQSVSILTPLGSVDQAPELIEFVSHGSAIKPYDTVLCSKDGQQVDVSLSISPIRNSEGKVVGASAIAQDIRERKRFERELKEAERKYRNIFDGAIEGMFINLPDGKPMVVNRALATMLGYDSPDEFISTVNNVVHEVWKDPRERQKVLAAVEEHGAVRGMECELRRKDGSNVWVSLTCQKGQSDENQAYYLEGFVADINEHKQAEMELRLSEERYRAAFQTSLDAININRVDDGTYIECNKAFLDIIGYSREEIVGHSSLELGIWVDPQDRQRMIEALRLEGCCRDMEALFRRKNGEAFWGRMSASAIEINGVACVLTISRDISDAKAAELLLVEATTALRISEERYRKVFHTSLDSITLSRADNRKYIDVNQAFLDTMGFERSEVIGRTADDLNLWTDPRDLENVREMLTRTRECRNVEIQFRKKSGETCWALMSVSIVEIEGVRCALAVARDVSHAKEAEDAIRNLAFYDPLTNLPNRRLLLERLEEALAAGNRTGRMRALLFVDLDNFKTLNDTLGHQTGDLLLQEASRRLTTCVRESDTVGRLGGDEFVLMLEDLSEVPEEAAAQAKAVGEKILFTIAQPYMLAGRVCRSGASIGICLFGDRRENSSELLQQADIAMYQAKAAGRNTMRFFAPALQAAVNTRATLEEELRQGIRNSQFVLYYQPQIDRNRLIGAEALIRWNHPVRSILPPGDFISLAEETGLILPIGKWVLDAACAQIAMWTARKQTAHLSISVNISARQFRQPDFVAEVLMALNSSGANPRNLKLELTESMLVENVEDVIDKMTELKLHGLRFSLDDFGTGYSSLAYLKRLPLDQLKIDRSFVRDILVDESSAAIAQTIVSLSRAMGLPVIAEGVETEAQREFLIRIGCHAFQGFLFSQPLPLKEFEDHWLTNARNAVSAGD